MSIEPSQAIRDLLDREAIRDLAVRYCERVWQDDADGYVALFTPDGEIRPADTLLTTGAQGHDALRAMIVSGMIYRPRPFLHNHLVELTGPDSAEGTCYKEIRVTLDGERYLLTAEYHDHYVRFQGEWRFRSRDFITHAKTKILELP